MTITQFLYFTYILKIFSKNKYKMGSESVKCEKSDPPPPII